MELVGGSAFIKAVRRGGRSLGRACAFQGSLLTPRELALGRGECLEGAWGDLAPALPSA